jgi:uroporphyrinogen-III decarboxylase
MEDIKKSFIFDTQITTHAIRLANVNAIEMLNDARLFLDTQKYVYSYYKLDKICTVYDVYNIESDALGQKIKYFDRDFPAVDGKYPFIKEKSDLKKVKNINFYNNKRCRFVLDLISNYKDFTDSHFKPRFCAPFSLAVNIRGYNNLINDIYNDKKFVKDLFKVINYELLAPWISIQRKEIGDNNLIASGADAWVTIPNVNLMIFNDVIVPSFLELEGLVGNIYLSIMGGARYLKDPGEFLDIQRILNPFLVKGFDPDVEALGPEMFKDYANQNNMDLLLGIDPNFIMNYSLEKIIERMENYIKTGLSNKKNFILYFNDIPADISQNKLKEIFNEVKKIRGK